MNRAAKSEQGFTLLEILLAMIVLSVGGIGILSLFAAAVTSQYNSVVNERKADILTAMVNEAQEELNRHNPTADEPVPKNRAREKSPVHGRDFEIALRWTAATQFPAGEGAVAEIDIFYRGQPVDTVRRILQRRVFSRHELEESVSYKQDQAADAARQGSDDDEDGGKYKPK